MGCVFDHLVVWGIPNFEFLIFGFIESSNFIFFFYLEFLRRALIAPDAATGGGSSLKLCVDSISGVDSFRFRGVAIVLKYTFPMWSG